jgi:hypothetical protein
VKLFYFYIKLKSKLRGKKSLIYYAVLSNNALPRNESLSLSDFLSQDALIWLASAEPGKLFCLACSIK